jgi:hypothetical protein
MSSARRWKVDQIDFAAHESAAVLLRQRDYLMEVLVMASDQIAAGRSDLALSALSAASRMYEIEQ